MNRIISKGQAQQDNSFFDYYVFLKVVMAFDLNFRHIQRMGMGQAIRHMEMSRKFLDREDIVPPFQKVKYRCLSSQIQCLPF